MNAQDTPLDASSEEAAAALVALWLSGSPDHEAVQREAGLLVEAAAARGEPRLADFSSALAAMRQHLVPGARPTGAQPSAGATLEQLLAPGTWPRARWLAQAVLAIQAHRDLARNEELRAMLREPCGPPGQARLAVVQACREMVLAGLLSIRGEFDEALQLTMKARAATRAGMHDLVHLQLGLTQSYIFLSVGDVEAACDALRLQVQLRERLGDFSLSVHYNLLLALALAERFEEADQVVERWAVLREEAALAQLPILADMLALIRLRQGRIEEARMWLERPQPALPHPPAPPLRANHGWLRGTVLLGLGRPHEARAIVEEVLREVAPAGDDASQTGAAASPVTPMNATQLYRVLSQACEAGGDVAGALAALKRSQASCASWVGDSIRTRLGALHLQAHSVDAQKQARRLGEVGLAVQRARQELARQERQDEHGSPAQRDRGERDLADRDQADRDQAERDLAERDLAERDLAEREESLARQRRFLAHVVHEMRNPLSAMMGMTSLAMMSAIDEKQRQYLDLAQSSAQMLMALCNDVLDLAKIDAGRFALDPQPVDVAALLREAVRVMRPLAQPRGVAIECDIGAALPVSLRCDALRLRQVVMNLLGNAVKFTRRGRIEVSAAWAPSPGDPGGGELRVAVQDTGPGIAAEALARLFQEFVQADPGVAGRHGGTGLGLALCRSLMQLMGGRIGAESTPGQGSTFWFTLPLHELLPSAAATAGVARGMPPPAGAVAARPRRLAAATGPLSAGGAVGGLAHAAHPWAPFERAGDD